MKITNINQQSNRQFFNGGLASKSVKYLTEHPKAIAALAGSSVIAQKLVMAASESVVTPAMDIAIGKAITKTTDEKNGETNKNSKAQAIRTFAQSTGGTIIGVVIRGIGIAIGTLAMAKVCGHAGRKIANEAIEQNTSKWSKKLQEMANIVNEEGLTKEENMFEFQEKVASWGRNVGGAAATLLMFVTNFFIDLPFINYVNKITTEFVNKHFKHKDNAKEVDNAK